MATKLFNASNVSLSINGQKITYGTVDYHLNTEFDDYFIYKHAVRCDEMLNRLNRLEKEAYGRVYTLVKLLYKLGVKTR